MALLRDRRPVRDLGAVREAVHHPAPAPVLARPLRALFRGVAAGVVVLGALGVVAVLARPGWALFDLDGERTVPAFFSGVLLALCSAGAAAAAGARVRARAPGTSLRLLSALFGAMALDEVFEAHEWAERQSGIDWQVLYAPLVALGAVAYLVVAWAGRRRRAVLRPWLAGAVAWGASQVLEFAQWTGDVPRQGYVFMMVPEEVLEMSGSALWLLALATMLTVRASRPLPAGEVSAG
jgi:hypothetical protein